LKKMPEEEARRWLLQATDEFADAEDLRKRERFYLALFHFQQAAEQVDPAFARVKKSKALDAYYIPTRYPNGLPGGVPSRFYDDPAQAEEAGRLARQVIETVQKAFP